MSPNTVRDTDATIATHPSFPLIAAEEHHAQGNVLASMSGLPVTLTISAEKFGGHPYLKIHSITGLGDAEANAN